MLKHDTTLASLRVIARELLMQDDIGIFFMVHISVVIPICFDGILKMFHVKSELKRLAVSSTASISFQEGSKTFF